MILRKISLLRRHPVLAMLAVLFFAVSLTIIIALLAGGTTTSTSKRPRRHVNRYRLPAEFSFAGEMIGPREPNLEQLETEPAPAAETIELNSRMFTVVTLVLAVIAGVTIGALLSHFMIH